MKTLILTALILITSLTSSQSVLTLESGTSMGVTSGANLCFNIINGPGILYGSGTICGGLVAIEPVVTNELPSSFDMLQNYPNPFNPVTVIKYQIPKSTYVSIKIFDQLGRAVSILYEGNQQAGYYQLTVDGANLASGVYYCRLNAGDNSKVIKMLMVK